MKKHFTSRAALSIAALAAASSLFSSATAAGEGEPCPAVSLSESDCGTSSCVIVFARVGERFRYELTSVDGESAEARKIGKHANGEKSRLPAGLVFKANEGTLEGVPQRPGFHEFVVVSTAAGTPREQVVLIDIQGHSFAGGGVDYASYVAGGIH